MGRALVCVMVYQDNSIQFLRVLQSVEGWTTNTSSTWQKKSNEYARQTMNKTVNLLGINGQIFRYNKWFVFMAYCSSWVWMIELGGYLSYFTEPMSVNLPWNYALVLSDYPAWALKVMTLSRFKQICSAFHPKFGLSVIGAKCHQLQHAPNTLN